MSKDQENYYFSCHNPFKLVVFTLSQNGHHHMWRVPYMCNKYNFKHLSEVPLLLLCLGIKVLEITCRALLISKTELKLDFFCVFPQEFVDWLYKLSLVYLTPDSSYQRKKTVLLLMSAVLETCTDTWSPDRKKGQPPGNKTSYTYKNLLW